MLLVGDGMDRYQWSFQIAADGSLVNGEPFQRLEMPEEGLFSGVGGLTVDSLGYMWATSAMGIQVCEQPGRCTNILNKPEFTATPMTDIAFGGPGRAWLYVTQGGKISPGNQTHRRRRVGTGQTAAAGLVMVQNPSTQSRRADQDRPLRLVGRLQALLHRERLRSPPAQETAKTVADGVYTDAQAARGAAVYDTACAGCHRADLGGATGPALREQRFARGVRRQGSEDAVHEDCDDDAAGRAGKPRRQRLSRHRRPHAEGERIPGRVAGAHRRCARRHPRAAGTAQAAAADRRFLLCRSGRLPRPPAPRTPGC